MFGCTVVECQLDLKKASEGVLDLSRKIMFFADMQGLKNHEGFKRHLCIATIRELGTLLSPVKPFHALYREPIFLNPKPDNLGLK